MAGGNPPRPETVFIRKLAPSQKQKLASMLDSHEMWERVAAKIPKMPDHLFRQDEDWEPRYTLSHIQHFKSKGGSPTKLLLQDWGMKNVTLKHLEQVLRLARMRAAADYVAEGILQRPGSGTETTNSHDHQESTPSLSTFPSGVAASRVGISESHSASSHISLPSIPVSDVGNDFLSPTGYNNVPFAQSMTSSASGQACAEELPSHVNAQDSRRGFPSQQELDSGLVECSLPSIPQAQATRPKVAALQSANDEDDGTQLKQNWRGEGGAEPQLHHTGSEVGGGLSGLSNQDQCQLDSLNSILQAFSLDSAKDVVQVPYATLSKITDNFNERDLFEGGSFIGEGGFGCVYLGTFNKPGLRVAVKRMKENVDNSIQQLEAEIKTLVQCKHKNLVCLIGYSVDGPLMCLIYQYMANGSLEDRLACKHGTQPLSPALRLDIMKGTACGINYLHLCGLIHLDIKSANILLDTDFTPKVGDFATSRMLPSGGSFSQMLEVSKIIGTCAFLAPEAFSSHVHQGLDCYSFGVVLLEVLTGLPVIDRNRSEFDLKLLVQQHCDDDEEDEDGGEAGTIFDLLDTKGGPWEEQVVELLYNVSNRCLETKVKRRAKMKEIVSWLEEGRISS